MAALTQVDIECLEFQTGFLSGLVLGSWGEPEQLNQYASHYASTLDLLGRNKESAYYATIATAAASRIGQSASTAWTKRRLRHRLFASTATRQHWQAAYTDSLFMEADDKLRLLFEETAVFRAQISHHFEAALSVR